MNNSLKKSKEEQFGSPSINTKCFIVLTKKKTQHVEDSNSNNQAMIKANQENAIFV